MKYCPYCDRIVSPIKKSLNAGCLFYGVLFILSTLTCGAFFIFYLLARLVYRRPRICPICGGKVVSENAVKTGFVKRNSI